MPIKRPEFANGEIYHIIIRGVGDSLIFKNKGDYYRGIFSLYEFNTTRPVIIREKRKQRKQHKYKEPFSDKREKMVEILAFCLMPNHIHLLLWQRKKNGISEFARKFGAGYVGYFNRKHDRKGPLFGKFRAVHVATNNQLEAVYCYIHTNPASIADPAWKKRGTRFPKKAVKFIEGYKWSSYRDYCGQKNFPSVTEREFVAKSLGGPKRCCKLVQKWVKYKKDIVPEMSLE